MELFPDFKRWFRFNYDKVKIPELQTFKYQMLQPRRLGPQTGKKCWLGVRLKPSAATVIRSSD
jgi:hypothetical protein